MSYVHAMYTPCVWFGACVMACVLTVAGIDMRVDMRVDMDMRVDTCVEMRSQICLQHVC